MLAQLSRGSLLLSQGNAIAIEACKATHRLSQITTSRQTVRRLCLRYMVRSTGAQDQGGHQNWLSFCLNSSCGKMTRRLLRKVYSFLVCNGVDVSLSGRCTQGCTGLFEGQPTLNLIGKQINKSVWNGLSYIFTTAFTMSFGQNNSSALSSPAPNTK